jgi:hypothetical protein
MKNLFVTAAAMAMGAMLASVSSAHTMLVQMRGPSELVGIDSVLQEAGFIDEGDTATDLPDGDLRDAALDFLDADPEARFCARMPLLNPRTKKQIGYGVDCLIFEDLSGKNNVFDPGPGDPGLPTLGVRAISFFITRKGSLVNDGATSIQPFVDMFGNGSALADGNEPAGSLSTGGDNRVTHMTGSIPDGDSHILAGNRRFEQVWGFARVSGAVSVLPLGFTDGEGVTYGPDFNCLWEIKLNYRTKNRRRWAPGRN